MEYTGIEAWTRDGDDNANVLAGGRGDDLLVGSGGFDTFVFDPHGGDDTIQDFDANDAERIDLSNVAQITDFIDLITNHLSSTDGTATIDYLSYSILLTGWTVADLGVS